MFRLNERGQLLPHEQGVLVGESVIVIGIGIQLHIFQMLLDGKVVPVQLAHLLHHVVDQRLAKVDQLRRLVVQILQLVSDLRLEVEDSTGQRDHVGGGFAFVHAEELEVAAEVEDVKLVLVRAVQKSRAEAGAAADHLPELGLAHDLFEEDQIQHLRHVDAGVQHIHRNGDLRQLLRVGKLIDGALDVGHVVVDDLGPAHEVRVLLAEDLEDLFGVGVVLGKDDGLADLVAVVDLEAVGHEDIQHLADGVLVEDPLVEG